MDSYLVFDFETTGLSHEQDRIIQVGLCRVVDGSVAFRDGWLVRQDVPISPAAQRIHGITVERIRASGLRPAESLGKLLEEIARAPLCVGHNIHLFDILFLRAECKRLGVPAPATHDFIDTAAFYKGRKLGMRKRGGESEHDYAHRVLSKRVAGLKYSIPVCVRDLRISADASELHDAGNDAYVTHLIFEALKPLV